MKLAIFDDYRLGVVSADEQGVVDVSGALPWPHETDPFGAGWWVRLCRDFESLRGRVQEAASAGEAAPLSGVTLRAPVLNPSKIVAAAVNYAAHHEEMKEITARLGGPSMAEGGGFDVFLKPPSSIIGPGETVCLPPDQVALGKEIHHESELAFVIGKRGKNIPAERAYDHILGYLIALDMTVRGSGDRTRRKGYDTFTPMGPWIVTADEVPNPLDLRIHLRVNGQTRQDVSSGDMTVKIPDLVAYASKVYTLEPGDVISTGAPPGVGPVKDGDEIEVSITRVGSMRLHVRNG